MRDRLARDAGLVQDELDRVIATLPPGDLRDAMGYAVRGGKRLRAFLVMESARLHGMSDDAALPVAAAVEALHAYSLVHDDLPAMDDDDLRRGQPTVHVTWTEATAILAGDALQTLAFQMLADPRVGDAATRIALVAALARASGAAGMVWGQALDIAAESAGTPLDLDQITELQGGKTGALIRFSAVAGALIAGRDPAPMDRYATALGLAFQIADDILDVEGYETVTGKRVGKDADAGKATFVSLMGLDGARAEARRLVTVGIDALADYGPAAGNLHELARFVIERDT
ncbi:polyprenyl synthetase family protein [Paracoccus aestuarii]|uniref:Geranylgeranyl diphosphate synthase n=1 Tax=Paracoccus aestuarii TaxID=453842 RepID=A0A419A222_9RHOB|nr:farnesyl diphosphate synthase [Paracoccus aestuarii]RJL07145.1 polyprenyl synthetase family protein [Paracoccus aestuarii]WCQ99554.1 polyprenyl synthetase family protein [Paracoccus aestuarii]